MLVDNPHGIPQGNTDDPIVVNRLREGIPPLISTPVDLNAAIAKLERSQDPVAIDVERAQGFRYGSDPYLIQIRREDTGSFLIDPAALPDLSALNGALGKHPWLLHNAHQDLANLHQVGLHCPSLFDTEVAARLSGVKKFSLRALCESILGFTLDKEYQASDWSVRPIPQDWLRYAALDVEFLTEITHHLTQQLYDFDRWQWAIEEFDHIMSEPAPPPKPHRWRLLSGLGKITSRRSLAVVRGLWEARERVAHDIDIAPTRLFRNSTLVRIGQQPPKNKRDLMRHSEFRSPHIRPYTDIWLQAIHVALHLGENELPQRRVPAPAGTIPPAHRWKHIDADAFKRLQLVREVIQTIAQEHDLDAEVVLEPKAQRTVAWEPLTPRPGTTEVTDRLNDAGVRQWQQNLVCAPLAKALSS